MKVGRCVSFVIHAVHNGMTLCGREPRKVWDGTDAAVDCETCRRNLKKVDL